MSPADEPSPEKDLITVLLDLTAAVEDAAGAVTAVHSAVSGLTWQVAAGV